MAGYELFDAGEVLAIKLGIWATRLEYAREIGSTKRIAECEHAVTALTAKLAAAVA